MHPLHDQAVSSTVGVPSTTIELLDAGKQIHCECDARELFVGMSKPIELIYKTSWDSDTFGNLRSIDTNPIRNRILLASSNNIYTWNFVKGEVKKRITFAEKICATSYHPSGNHILVGFTNNLRLANVLANEIQVFWQTKTRLCVDCKFNTSGTLFAAICGMQIETYDFMNGVKIATIDCDLTAFCKLSWGTNCLIYATCYEGLLLSTWDALQSTKMSEFRSSICNILEYYVRSDDRKSFLTTSNDSILILSRDLKCESEIRIEEDCHLNGPITASNEGMVFVSITSRKEPKTEIIRTYRITDNEHFDQSLGTTTVILMKLCAGNCVCIRNESLFCISSRGAIDHSIITEVGHEKNSPQEDPEVDILVAASYIQDKNKLLKELQSRAKDLEMTNEVEVQRLKTILNSELQYIESNYNKDVKIEKEKFDALIREKDLAEKKKVQLIEKVDEMHSFELKQCEQDYVDILQQVKIYDEMEKEWKTERMVMNEKKQELLRKQLEEIDKLQFTAQEKISKQINIRDQLLTEKGNIERESEEMIVQLKEDIHEEIALLRSEIESKLNAEDEICEKLQVEKGILIKRLASTRKAIDDEKGRYLLLLEKYAEKQDNISRLRIEKERLDTELKAKECLIALKDTAGIKLSIANEQVIKAVSTEEGKVHKSKSDLDGPLKEKIQQINQQILLTEHILEVQHRAPSLIRDKIEMLEKSVATEESKIDNFKGKIHRYDAIVERYLIGLQNCKENIQKPLELKRILQSLAVDSQLKSLENFGRTTGFNDVNDDSYKQKLDERSIELHHLKMKESALTAQYNEERQARIAINASILEINMLEKSKKK